MTDQTRRAPAPEQASALQDLINMHGRAYDFALALEEDDTNNLQRAYDLVASFDKAIMAWQCCTLADRKIKTVYLTTHEQFTLHAGYTDSELALAIAA